MNTTPTDASRETPQAALRQTCRERVPGVPLTAMTTLAAMLSGAMMLLGACATPLDAAPSRARADARAPGTVVAPAATPAPSPAAGGWAVNGDAQPDGRVEPALAGDQRFCENDLAPPPLAGALRSNHNAPIGATWELDLFGH